MILQNLLLEWSISVEGAHKRKVLMLLSEQLREENANPSKIFDDNQEIIQKLYTETLAASLVIEEQQDESFGLICVMMVICLLKNLDEVPRSFEIEYDDEDAELISRLAESLGYYLTFEAMCSRGLAKKKIINGSPVYSTSKSRKSVKKAK